MLSGGSQPIRLQRAARLLVNIRHHKIKLPSYIGVLGVVKALLSQWSAFAMLVFLIT